MLSHKEQIGRLDRRIVIQESTLTKDEYGQETTTWATFFTVWAKVEDRSGSEGYQADQLTATRNTVFTIRWIAGLTEKMRILYNYDYYDIQYIKSPDRKRTLEVGTIKVDDPEEQDPTLAGIFDSTFDTSFE